MVDYLTYTERSLHPCHIHDVDKKTSHFGKVPCVTVHDIAYAAKRMSKSDSKKTF